MKFTIDHLEFIRTGELDDSFDRLLAYAEKDRKDADYAPAATFTDELTRERLEAARRLVAEARRRVGVEEAAD